MSLKHYSKYNASKNQSFIKVCYHFMQISMVFSIEWKTSSIFENKKHSNKSIISFHQFDDLIQSSSN